MKLVVTQTQNLPADVYTVRLDTVELVQGAYGEQIRWKFTVIDGEHSGATLTAWSNLSTALTSKTMKWAAVLSGERFGAGDVVDFDRLKGRQCRAVVETKTSGDGRAFARVTDILPLKRVKHGMVAVPATKQGFYEVADDEDPDDPFAQA